MTLISAGHVSHITEKSIVGVCRGAIFNIVFIKSDPEPGRREGPGSSRDEFIRGENLAPRPGRTYVTSVGGGILLHGENLGSALIHKVIKNFYLESDRRLVRTAWQARD